MEYLFEVALKDDERGRSKEAESLYKSAIEFALEAVRKRIIVCRYLVCLNFVDGCVNSKYLVARKDKQHTVRILCPFRPLIFQQKKIGDQANKTKLLTLTTKAIERLEQLKQKNKASAPELDDLLDQLPPPPSSDPLKGSSKASSGRGPSSTNRKFIGKCHNFTKVG